MPITYTNAYVSPKNLKQPVAQGIDAGVVKICRADYDFAVDGGAAGTIALLGSTDIPANAIILGGALVIETALTSAGAATAALHVEGAGDLVVAALVSGAPWSSTGNKDIIPDATGSTAIKTTAARDVTLTIAVAALTAGKFQVYLSYMLVA